MPLVWLFWLALAIPGLAVLAYLRPDHDGEPMSALQVLGLAYLATFVLLTPFSIIGYCMKLPLWWLSGATATMVAGGLVILIRARARWWPLPRPDVVGVCGGATLLLLLYQAAAMGGHMFNDADFHLARIRFLRDHGLSNADPFVGTGFVHPYHTNLYHALIAAGSQLTGVDVLEFWSDTLPWSKLVLATGVFILARRLGARRIGAWFGALLYVAWSVRSDATLYPNGIAPGWLVPVAIGSCVSALTGTRPRVHLAALAACAVVAGEVHGLYAGYLGLLVAGAVVPITLFRLFIRREQRGHALGLAMATLFAVSLSAPFLYVAKSTHQPAQRNFDYSGGPPSTRPRDPDAWLAVLQRNTDDELYLPFKRSTNGPLTLVALLGGAALLCARRPRRAAAFLPALGLFLGVLFTPPLATLAAQQLGAAWVLERSLGVLRPLYAAVIGAGLSIPLASIALQRFAAPLMTAGVLFIGLCVQAKNRPLSVALASLPDKLALDPLADHVDALLRRDQALLAKLIPRGSVVLTHPMAARQLAKLHDMRFVRCSRNHTGVPDLMDRTYHMWTFMSARSARSLGTLLKYYDIDFAIQFEQHSIRWLKYAKPVIGETATLKVIRVRSAE